MFINDKSYEQNNFSMDIYWSKYIYSSSSLVVYFSTSVLLKQHNSQLLTI